MVKDTWTILLLQAKIDEYSDFNRQKGIWILYININGIWMQKWYLRIKIHIYIDMMSKYDIDVDVEDDGGEDGGGGGVYAPARVWNG